MGVVGWCFLYVGRALSPQTRYAVLCGLFVLLAAFPTVTFCVLIDRPASGGSRERLAIGCDAVRR